jgi:lysophospholipase L1-like esterase
LQRLIARAHERNIRFICSTLTPFEGAKYWTPAEEAERQKINSFIRGDGSGCDGIVDQDAATHDPAHPTRYLAAYDSGDHLHPNNAGHKAIANAINLKIFKATP